MRGSDGIGGVRRGRLDALDALEDLGLPASIEGKDTSWSLGVTGGTDEGGPGEDE